MRFLLALLLPLTFLTPAPAQQKTQYYLGQNGDVQQGTTDADRDERTMTAEDRVRQLETRLDSIDNRLARIERVLDQSPYKPATAGAATPAAPSMPDATLTPSTSIVPRSAGEKIQDASGNYWTVRADGRIEWCHECNGGRPDPTKIGTTVAGPIVNPNWQPAAPAVAVPAPFTALPVHPHAVPYTTRPTTVQTVGAVSTMYQVGWEAGGTPTPAAVVGRPGIIRSIFRPVRRVLGGFRSGGWGSGGC